MYLGDADADVPASLPPTAPEPNIYGRAFGDWGVWMFGCSSWGWVSLRCCGCLVGDREREEKSMIRSRWLAQTSPLPGSRPRIR